MPDTSLILHVKGTQQTTSLPKDVVRAGIAQGQISRSQLIWSPLSNAWKQVRELPHLLPSQKLAPPPPPRVNTGTLPKIVQATEPTPKIAATGKVPRIAGGQPTVKVKVPSVQVSSHQSDYEIKSEPGFNYAKWIFIGLGSIIALAVGVNYLIIERPLLSAMKQTPFSNQMVYAHLGAFVQPDALVIHLPVSAAVTPDNLVSFLGAVARSTPEEPFNDGAFDRVSLSTGLMGHYSLSGFAWKKFGDMTQETDMEKKAFLLQQLSTNAGMPLSDPNSTLDADQLSAQRDSAWADFVAYLTK